MELVAYLDDRHVEMHILTDTGKTVSIVCERDSIFAVQRHIESLGRECPEIATWNSPQIVTWKPVASTTTLHDNGHGSYVSALTDRRHRSALLAAPGLNK